MLDMENFEISERYGKSTYFLIEVILGGMYDFRCPYQQIATFPLHLPLCVLPVPLPATTVTKRYFSNLYFLPKFLFALNVHFSYNFFVTQRSLPLLWPSISFLHFFLVSLPKWEEREGVSICYLGQSK